VKGPSNRPDPDRTLIQRAQSGDRDAMKTLLQEVSPTVSQWALSHTGNPDDAADLLQEVLILLVRKLPAYKGESKFLTWLFTVTRNQAIEVHRKRGRQERKMEHMVAKNAQESSYTAREAGNIDSGRIMDLVAAFLGELPQRQREVFQMADLQGLTSPEIGEILGLNAGGVRAALFKARRTLRRRILDQHPEFVEEYLK
jgi:RNA polymerase sigma-70 factor (ECF subfamily)